MQLLLLPASLFLSAAGLQVCSGNWGAEPTSLPTPWVQFIAQVCYPTKDSSLGITYECVVVSHKHEINSPDSLPCNAVSCYPWARTQFICSVEETAHELVQATCNSISQCSPLLLAFCLSNSVSQNKTGVGHSGRFKVILKSGKIRTGIHSTTALFPMTIDNEFVESN